MTTTAANGFNNFYGASITLSSSGSFEITNPNWNEGNYTVNLDCFDDVGNGPTTTTGLGPVIIDQTPPVITLL